MYENSNAQTLSTEKKEQTELQTILSLFESQTQRYSDTVSRLEKVGHRLKDTNVPQSVEKEMAAERPLGIVGSFYTGIDVIKRINNRMEEIVSKLDSII